MAFFTIAGLSAADTVEPVSTYRCEDDLTVTKAGKPVLRLQSRTLVQLTMRGTQLHVDVRGDQPAGAGSQTYKAQAQETLQGIAEKVLGSSRRVAELVTLNPGITNNQALENGTQIKIPVVPGEDAQVLLTVGTAAPVISRVPVLQFQIDQEDGKRSVIDGSPMPQRFADELSGMLAQGPAANVLRSNALKNYSVRVLSGISEADLKAAQTNGKLMVDLSISGDGDAVIGNREWQLPMSFDLPRQTPRSGVTLQGNVSLTYASIRPGPENEVYAVMKADFGSLHVDRVWILTPVPRQLPRLPTSAPKPAAPTSDGGLGPIGSWTRLGALSLLGVHRLPGLSEAGLALWGVAAATDLSLESKTEDPQIAAVVDGLPVVTAPPPGQVPRSDLERAVAERDSAVAERDGLRRDTSGPGLIEVDAALSVVSTSGTLGGLDLPKGTAFAPTLDLRIALGERFRWGGEASLARHAQGGSGNDHYLWSQTGLGLLGGWRTDRWSASLSAGAALHEVTARVGLESATNIELDFQMTPSAEVKLGQRWSVAARAHFVSGSSDQALTIIPSVRYWYRPYIGFHVQGYYDSITSGSKTDEVKDSAIGFGFGLVVRR